MISFREGSPLYKLWRHMIPRRRAYQIVFCGEDKAAAKALVLLDLARYCHADAPCNSERESGRRDVWLRIRQMTKLPDEELTVLYAKLTPEQRHQIYYPSATFTE